MGILRTGLIFLAISTALFTGGAVAGNISIGGGVVNTGVISGCGNGCISGSGVKKTEERNVPPFSAMNVNGAYEINIQLQKKQRIEVTGDDNILPHIVTKVSGGTLTITSDKSISTKVPLRVDIFAGDIEKIVTDGSNEVSVNGVRNKKLALELNGTSSVSATGATKTLSAKLSGTGSLQAKDLKAEDVRVILSGAGDAEVYASRKLRAEIEGAGDISYYGNPGEVVKDITGAGSIEKKD